MSEDKIRQAGLAIRNILHALYSEGHSEEQERTGIFNHSTDAMRVRALEYAGICQADTLSGEMAPGCSCGWSSETGIVKPTKDNPWPGQK